MKRIRLALICVLGALHAYAVETEIVGWGTQPPLPSLVRNAVQVAGGDQHSVALLSDGTAIGWSFAGFADNRAAAFTAADLATYVRPGAGAATAIIKVCAGAEHSLYWLNNGMVVSRGRNVSNKIGVFPFSGDVAGYEIIDVACSLNANAVAYKNGTNYFIRVWGNLTGAGDTTPRMIQSSDINLNNRPWNISFPISKIACGSAHLSWIMNNGTAGVVTGVGDFNSIPQNGNGNNSGATAISSGNGFTMWLKNGNVFASGFNLNGLVATNVASMSAGVGHELYLKNDGTVTAFASTSAGNDYGQAIVPQFLSGVLAVSAGRFHSLALITRKEPPAVSITMVDDAPLTFNLSWPSGYPEYNKVSYAPSALGVYANVSVTPVLFGGSFNAQVEPSSANGPLGVYKLIRTY